jgi:DNA-binding NarL/FixJ family response regulator
MIPGLGRKKGITKDLILWRRIEVARLLSRGISVKAIAERLHVDARTIFEDQRYIRQHASKVLDKYLSKHSQ